MLLVLKYLVKFCVIRYVIKIDKIFIVLLVIEVNNFWVFFKCGKNLGKNKICVINFVFEKIKLLIKIINDVVIVIGNVYIKVLWIVVICCCLFNLIVNGIMCFFINMLKLFIISCFFF